MKKSKKALGPDKMTTRGRKKFFSFYKTHRSRALVGFLSDIGKNKENKDRLLRYLKGRRKVNCLIMGCSHWANPQDTINFLKDLKKDLKINMVVLDALPDAITDIVKHDIDCTPLLTPAQETPFLDKYFDLIVCDCLLTCCSFDQHEPVVREMSRIIKKGGLIMLGVAHSDKNTVFKMAERPIVNYCRPLGDYKKLFSKYRLVFPKNSSVETRLPGKWNNIRIENTVVTKY